MAWSKKMQEKQRNRVEALHEFAMRLQACAERAGLTQAEVGTRMGAKGWYVRNWFRGMSFPKGDAAKLAEIFSVSVEFLLHGNGAELPGVGEFADAGPFVFVEKQSVILSAWPQGAAKRRFFARFF